jgi:hypothetical protein
METTSENLMTQEDNCCVTNAVNDESMEMDPHTEKPTAQQIELSYKA